MMNNIHGKSVLLVEDEALLAISFQDMLEELGALVVGPALDIEHALELLAGEDHIDLAVLDVDLCGKTSMPVAKMLARLDVPYFFATGLGSRKLPYAPDVAILSKPFTSAQLGASLNNLIAHTAA